MSLVLAASESRKIFELFEFNFPDIHKKCPVCSASHCAIWKGYYSRSFFCLKLDFNGRIWVRKGLCKSTQTHFSLLPDFCIPYLRWSKFMFGQLLCSKRESLFQACDWRLAFSTLYWIGAYLVKLLRLNAHLYTSPPPATNSTCELMNYASDDINDVLLSSNFNWSKKIIPSSTSPPI